jgi:hypothetical protein
MGVQMKNNRLWFAAALGAALVSFTPTAKATVISYTFAATDSSYIVSGVLTIANALNAVFGHDFISINGVVTGVGGGNISGLVGNPNQPFPVVNSGFQYNNVGFDGDPHLDKNGVLFSTTNGSLWNLWGNGPGAYELFKYADVNGPQVDTLGTLSTEQISSAVPEIDTWAMMLLGFGMVGFFAYRRAQKSSATAAVA